MELKAQTIPFGSGVSTEIIAIDFRNGFNYEEHKELLEAIDLYKYYDSELGVIKVNIETLRNDPDFFFNYIIIYGVYSKNSNNSYNKFLN